MVRATLAGRIAVHKDCEKAKEGFRVDRRQPFPYRIMEGHPAIIDPRLVQNLW